ncbi:MAG: chemotaxis protein CheD [Gammaproteobacteria bacterium]|jgi:chemotaxis protein CheD
MPTVKKSDFPPTLPGFETVNRYWDWRLQKVASKILPGEFYVTRGNEIITTVLGSCVSACIRDTMTGVGGMNHFLLPLSNDIVDNSQDFLTSAANRYGNFAMENMINTILSYGGSRKRLEVKLFGGSQIISTMSNIGNTNIKFVYQYLKTEGFSILAEDLGGNNPRKVMYFPDTGKVKVKRIKELHNDTIIKREKDYIHTLETEPTVGEIDLF